MKKDWFLLLMASMMMGLQGCGSVQTGHSRDLVVMEHTDTIRGAQEWNNYEWAHLRSMCLLMARRRLSIR